jgi:hypothetical protein
VEAAILLLLLKLYPDQKWYILKAKVLRLKNNTLLGLTLLTLE